MMRTQDMVVVDARGLRARAERLRRRAGHDDGPLAVSYRRRASELMLQAWLLEIRAGVPLDRIPAAA